MTGTEVLRLVKILAAAVLVLTNCYLLFQIKNEILYRSIVSEDGALVDLDNENTKNIQLLLQENLIKLKNSELKKQKTVLIVSDYRSGSSMIGEMFNQNDDVYYLFEPLKDYDLSLGTKDFIDRLLTCEPPSWGIQRRNRQNGCNQDPPVDKYKKSTCLRERNHAEDCKKYPILAAKFIRLRSIEQLEKDGILNNPNVFVVHHIRDPRGTINSRLSYSTVYYNEIAVPRSAITLQIIGHMAESLCDRYFSDAVFGDSRPNNYLRLTYENICEDPARSIARVYEMLGLPPPQRVLNWFSEHTSGASISAEHDKMGLVRNSKLTAARWKEELDPEFVCEIEGRCKRFMDYMGLEYACKSPRG